MTNGSICLKLPAFAFVSWAFDVIDTWCFQRRRSSALQCVAQNKSEGEGTLCELGESPHQRGKEEQCVFGV